MAVTRQPLALDDLTPGAVAAGILHDRRVTVLGLARSGLAMARFFTDAGAEVTIYDSRPADDLRAEQGSLAGRSVRFVLGPGTDPADSWSGADLVATSPSINPDYPTTEPRLRAALAALRARRSGGDRFAPAMISEPDLVLRLCPAPIVGVTGTKGKTTTSSLIATVLAADPAHPVALGGNIGDPLVDRVTGFTPDHRVVMELSELQLPTLSRGTAVAVYTNVTSDHLDRHGSLEEYRRVKRRLADLLEPGGTLVLNADDPEVAAYEAPEGVSVITYRAGVPLPGGVGLVDGWIVRAAASGVAGTPDPVVPIRELAVPGRHNVSNAMAAVAVGLRFGIAPDAIRRAIAGFRGVEHRLEFVAEIDGVRFVNDSMGTQPDAVMAALEAFAAPIVLIAGGRDKDVDLTALAALVAQRVHAAVLIGESAGQLERLFRNAGLQRVERAVSLGEAVARADAIARAAVTGTSSVATVLLSPAAASFDMFADYAERGRAFKAAVAAVGLARTPTAPVPGPRA
jgi:UDP-N-acetylmuramoylalanine--D-glutamate ligase